MSAKLAAKRQEYQTLLRGRQPSRPIAANCLRAFVTGGAVCVLGQAMEEMYIHVFGIPERLAGNPTVATLIILSALATGLGLYDRFAQWAGAGSAVPVTGFANAMSSSALEHRTEGLVQGIGANMFKVAGPVIVYGVVAAFFVGLIRYAFVHSA